MSQKNFADEPNASMYQSIIEKMMNAFALHKIILDAGGYPCDYEFISINPAFTLATGLTPQEAIGKRVTQIIPSIKQDQANWIEMYGKVALNDETITFESYSESLDKWYTINAFCPQKGYFITIFNDISTLKKNEQDLLEQNTAYKASQEQLHYVSLHDQLTGFPNTSAFYTEIDYKLVNTDSTTAIFSIDFDNFKLINGILGHRLGENLISAISSKLSSLLEKNQTIYRTGVDEFAICTDNYKCISEVIASAEKIVRGFEAPIQFENSILHITASIGIATAPEHGSNANVLLRNADIALRKAKQKGKNQFAFYEFLMDEELTKRLQVEKNLFTAMEKHEFSIHYQPQLDLHTNKVSGFEALLRWNNEELGQVPPNDFIDIAEETHLIIPIGKWVLRNACYFIKKLHFKGYTDCKIAVNVSALQLLQDDFVDTILTQVALIDLDPRYLELEVTESLMIESYEIIHRKLEILRSHGIKIAMDDFGKGFSSLSKLDNLPIDILKIDKVFMDSIINNCSNHCITDMIIMLGKKMGMQVLAEGVETQEQKDYLIANGCDVMQGYLFKKPMPETEVFHMFQTEPIEETPLFGFSWKSDYSININELDRQHKKIFELGNRAAQLIYSKENEYKQISVTNIIQELKQYTEQHFKSEEALMQKQGYVYLQNHTDAHNALIEKLDKAFMEYSQYASTDFYINLVDLILVWITNHILIEDRKFGDFASLKLTENDLRPRI